MNGNQVLVRRIVETGISVTALIISAQFEVQLPGLSVPFTMQTLVLILIGVYVMPWSHSLSVVSLYILLGLLGFPAFASAPNSLEMFFSSSAGYLLGFILAVFTLGRYSHRKVPIVIMFFAAHLIILIMGVIGLCINRQMPLSVAIINGSVPFIAGAVAKSVLGWIIYILINNYTSRH